MYAVNQTQHIKIPITSSGLHQLKFPVSFGSFLGDTLEQQQITEESAFPSKIKKHSHQPT